MNDLNPVITVIVPCHDVEAYVGRTLDALLGQDFALPYRIVAVEDFSSDRTLAILKETSQRFPGRLTVLTSPAPGLTFARNAAFPLALKSKYVCFSDADDVPHPNFLSSLYALAEKTKADVGVMGYCYAYPDGTKKKDRGFGKRILEPRRACGELVKDSRVKSYVWNKIYRSELLKRTGIRFLPERFVYEDQVFTFQCFAQADRVAFSPEPIYDYTVRKGSLSHSANPLGFLMHANCYAALRAYAAYRFGDKEAFKLFSRLKGTMNLKLLADIYPARRRFLSKKGFREAMRTRSLLLNELTQKDFKVAGKPWEKYILDMGFLVPPQLGKQDGGNEHGGPMPEGLSKAGI